MVQYNKNIKNKKKGFTLVELMVVLAITAILAALVGGGLIAYTRLARFEKNEANARTLFQTAQISLTRMETAGELDAFRRQVMEEGDTGDHFQNDVTVTDALDGLAMDLAPAYGSVPGLGRYRRSVHLTDTGLTLRDETDYPGTVALTLMSVEKPAVDGDTVAFGALAAAAVTGADKIVTEAVPIADPRLRQAWPDTLYRTRIYFTQQLSLVIG